MTITAADIMRYDIGAIPKHYKVVDYHARKRIQQFFDHEANELSKVYKDWKERIDNFPKNAYCQMMGEYVINVYVYGLERGFNAFDQFRQWMNAHPKASDGKTDVPGYQVDIKTSHMQKSQKFLDYHMIVPPNDKQPMHLEVTDRPENIFALGLVKKGHCDTTAGIMIVHMAGWCWNHEIDIMHAYEPFKDKFVLEAAVLHPMKELHQNLIFYEGD